MYYVANRYSDALSVVGRFWLNNANIRHQTKPELFMFWIVFLYKPFWWRPCTALITTSPDHRTISESFSFLQIPTIFHSLPSMVLSKAKTLTHHTSHAMRLINCRIIFKDQAVMVIELCTYKTWHRSKGLYNFFFQLAASVPVLLPLGAVSIHSTLSPSPCSPPHGFSPVLGTFCWHSLTHVLSLYHALAHHQIRWL